MITQIKNIGKYVNSNHPDKNIVDTMVNFISKDTIKYTLEINLKPGTIETNLVDFEEEVVKEALFYQVGRAFLGGGIRLDFYKESKVVEACNFCEVSKRVEEVLAVINDHLKESSSETFVILKINGKTPKELFSQKFLDYMLATTYKKIRGKSVCHLCGQEGEVFNTTAYKFYTNDKSTYGNVNNKDGAGFIICRGCLNNIILGKNYIKQYLSTYWLNKNVIFLPHSYDEDIAGIYESTEFAENDGRSSLLSKIRSNEKDVIEEIGKTEAVTDIVFYQEDSKFFYIYHSIQSILPSRFTLVAELLKKYDLKLFTVFNYTAVVKVLLDKIETTDKEQMRVLDAVFSGKKIDRNLFFNRAMDVYKHYYLKDEHKKFACMRTINRIYNFLCDCGCMNRGWNVMGEYQNYQELFDNNKNYFDLNEKKAWFILGRAYNTMIFYLKSNSKEGNIEQERTSLEKNFFFSRQFDFEDFIYFCNLLEEKARKYNQATAYFCKMISEAKELMANKENQLSADEAKYIFFWGLDSYFKKNDNKQCEEE